MAKSEGHMYFEHLARSDRNTYDSCSGIKQSDIQVVNTQLYDSLYHIDTRLLLLRGWVLSKKTTDIVRKISYLHDQKQQVV